MKGIIPIIIGILILAYAIYGVSTGQLYVPGRYTEGSYVAGGRLLFVFLSYLCVAIIAFLWAVPTKRIKFDVNDLTKNPQDMAAMMKAHQIKCYFLPKFIAIYTFGGLAIISLFTSLFFQNA